MLNRAGTRELNRAETVALRKYTPENVKGPSGKAVKILVISLCCFCSLERISGYRLAAGIRGNL